MAAKEFIFLIFGLYFVPVEPTDDMVCYGIMSKSDALSFLPNGKRSTPRQCCLEGYCENHKSDCYTEQYRKYVEDKYVTSMTCGHNQVVGAACPGHGYRCLDVCHALVVNDRCLHDGTCIPVVHNSTFDCNCRDGYRGTTCHVDIHKFETSPCHQKNSLMYYTYPSDYVCQCKAGYTGKNCELEIDECLSSPCRNGGTCTDRHLGYDCACASGWTGSNCEIECVRNISNCRDIRCTEPDNSTCISCEDGYALTDHGLNCFDLFSPYGYTCSHLDPIKCYIIFKVKATWEQAKAVCNARRGYLFSPDNLEEELYLEAYMQSMKVVYTQGMFWIGGRMSGDNRNWINWESNGTTTMDRWFTFRPVSPDPHLCVVMDGDTGYHWRAVPCDTPQLFICEEKVPFSTAMVGEVFG